MALLSFDLGQEVVVEDGELCSQSIWYRSEMLMSDDKYCCQNLKFSSKST